jgi:hypothetical protein
MKPTMSVNMIAASLRVSVAVFGRLSDMTAIILPLPPGCQTAQGQRKMPWPRGTTELRRLRQVAREEGLGKEDPLLFLHRPSANRVEESYFYRKITAVILL